MRFFVLIMLFVSCSPLEQAEKEKIRKLNEKKEKITRFHGDYFFIAGEQKQDLRLKYPWEQAAAANLVKINKEYFRCKGSNLNPKRRNEEGNKELSDCDGINQHGLPYRDHQEYVYPIFIDLLNYVQEKTGHRVVITCGHRCPTHNAYSDDVKTNPYSKHQLGAEVDFYVEGYEEQPLEIVKYLMHYYQDQADPFFRCQKNPENLEHPGWYNKEIALRLHQKNEGRDFDNRHPYPYLTIEVRFDRTNDQAVVFDWQKAHYGFVRN